MVGGKGGKKGKKQNKSKQAEGPKSFNIDFAVINKFGLVQVSPPLAPADLDHKIEELSEKQKMYQKNGDEILKKEREDLEHHIEKMVEEDIEREAKAAEQEEEYDEEEEETKDSRDEDGRTHSHRGRGGFNRAYGGRDEEPKYNTRK